MENSVYIEVFSNQDYFIKTKLLRLPLRSFITYCIYKFCAPNDLKLSCVVTNKEEYDCIEIKPGSEPHFIDISNVPWTVAMCSFPVAHFEDTVITGLCAVARHICKYRASPACPQEHEEGLLGFRKSCLQAPNEVSVWTKFCEVDLFKTVSSLLNTTQLQEVPENLVRFENHLGKPVRVHNVYKIAREIKKFELSSKESQTNSTTETTNRQAKNRKWKSKAQKELEVDTSTDIADLNISHQFAEGPFLTLADLILLPLYYILFQKIGTDNFESHLPLTHKWYLNILNFPEVQNLKNIFSTCNFKSLLVKNLAVPNTDNVSLYKCDPKRHNPKKRLFTKEDDIENALSTLLRDMELSIEPNELDFGLICWTTVPDGANPAAGHLPDIRMARKTQQLENLALAVMKIASDGDVIVDFCCGSGHLGILLAHLLPNCQIILLENKEQSLLRARKRVHDMGIKNVYFYQCNLDFFIGKFDVGIGLHACGVATDLVLEKCLKVNAKFVLCPCCYGSLHATDRLAYPRSNKFKCISLEKYLCIGHAADQTHEDHPLTVRGARCMAVIDSDRGHLAKELGYKVTLSKLKPLTCTPKNNLLIGVPT